MGRSGITLLTAAVIAVLVLAAAPRPTRALTASVFEGDTPVQIVAEKGKPIHGEFRVVGGTTSTVGVVVTAGTFVLEGDPTQRILPSKIRVPATISVAPTTAAVITVDVDAIEKSGTYSGKIVLSSPTSSADSLPIAVSIIVVGTEPIVSVAADQKITATLAGCEGWGCFAADLSQPGLSSKTATVVLQNASGSPGILKSAVLAVRGEKSGIAANDLISLVPHQSVPAHRVGIVKLVLDVGVPADHYVGTAYLEIDGQQDLIAVPVDLNLRSGPFAPFMVLLLAILAGVAVRFANGPGAKLVAGFDTLRGVERTLHEGNAEDAKLLADMVKEANAHLEARDIEKLTPVLDRLAKWRAHLAEIRLVEQGLNEWLAANPASSKEGTATARLKAESALKDATAARSPDLVRRDQLEKAQEPLTRAKAALDELSTASAGATTDQRSLLTEEAIAELVADLPHADRADVRARRRLPRSPADAAGLTRDIGHAVAFAILGWGPAAMWYLRILRDAVGRTWRYFRSPRGQADFVRLVRYGAYIGLIVGLAISGYQDLYLKSAVFGSGGLTDYVGLFVWGFGSEAVVGALTKPA
jgi:hypothetical protein